MDEEIKNKIENNIRNKRYYKKIRAMIVYGSWVRGDFDENSDIDILVITEGQYSIDENKIHEIVSECIQGRPIDISVYDAAKFETLLTSGSLFLHHVKDEGEIIFDRSGKGKNYLFGKLNEFKGISEDMLLYKRMYSKAVISLENNGVNYYDINILSLVARNTLILACYHQKQPKYGKWDAFHLCKDYFDTEIQLSEKCYKELLEYRNYFNRNLDKHELPNQNRCREYENQVGMLIDWGIKLTGVNGTEKVQKATHQLFGNCLFQPKSNYNLISQSQLIQDGYKAELAGNKYIILGNKIKLIVFYPTGRL